MVKSECPTCGTITECKCHFWEKCTYRVLLNSYHICFQHPEWCDVYQQKTKTIGKIKINPSRRNP